MSIQLLGDFRHEIRRFLHFSEMAATKVGLQPQQHQLLLQIAGATVEPTIGYLAERLSLRHNTVVELTNRCEQGGLLRRRQGEDRRVVILELTSKGKRLLKKLSTVHVRELSVLAPTLIRTLKRIQEAAE